MRRIALPTGVAVVVDGAPLGAGAGSLAWYYHTGTGATTRVAGGAFDQGLVEVGTAASTREDLWGLDNPAVNAQLPAAWRYRVVPTVLAPSPDEADHGLSVQTPDGRVRVAIAVHGTGLVDVREF